MSYFAAQEPACHHQHDNHPIEFDIIPRSVDLGGFEVRRVLPNSQKRMVGPFIFWDQAGPADFLIGQGIDVRPHPHICLSTMTYLFTGSLLHRDTLGSEQIISPGDVNLMTAGSGIAHSERTPVNVRQQSHHFFGIQCWLALPKQREEVAPDFKHYSKTSLPLHHEKGIALHVVVGSFLGLASPVITESAALFVDCKLSPGTRFSIPATTEERALYLLSGNIVIDGVEYHPSRMLVLKPAQAIECCAKEEEAHFIILGGDALDGDRYIWWNFVASTKERIEQAKVDWQTGKFGRIPGDDKEFIPLPG